MKLKIRSLHMENFKGIKSLDVNFSNKTSIKGQNAAGKTTIFDAFTWLLFNKNSAGEEKFNVRPLDKDGNRIDNVEIKVVGVIDVDGKEVELSKVQKQNWVKKRGTDTVALQGNVNSFEIDGYPKSEADFKEYISSLAQSEDMFKMLANPQYFSSMKWKEQRDILMRLVTDVSDVELAQTDAKYAQLLGELEKAPSTDDIRAKFQKALTEWKKKQSEIPVRIDEAEKSKVDVDVAEQELAKVDLVRRIAECDKKMENAGSTLGDLRSKEMQLQFDMSGIMQVMNDELSAKRRGLDSAKDDATREFNDLHNQIQSAENQIKANEKTISDTDAERKNLGVEYNAEFSKAFDEMPYLFDESKWKFDESTTVCSLCGQKLPDDKIEQLKADFETRKEFAKVDAARRLADAKNNFIAQKNSSLEEIKEKGFTKKNLIEELTKKNADLNTEVDTLKKQEQEAAARKEELSKQLSEIPSEADYSQNEEYVKLKARHNEVLAEIERLQAADDAEIVASLKIEKEDLKSQLEEINKIIAQAANNIRIDEQITDMQKKQREYEQAKADAERILYQLKEVSKRKNELLVEEINQHFGIVSWKLFDYQKNGEYKEVCVPMVDGKEFGVTTNTGREIQAKLDICNSFQRFFDMYVPIFLDGAESLNNEYIPAVDAQLILLSVSEDKQLKVEGV